MINLLPCPANQHAYAETPQSVGLRTALLNKTKEGLKPMFAPVMCRDFYNDLLHSQWSGQAGSIFNFTCDPKTQKLDEDAIRLLVVPGSQQIYDNLRKNLESILHEVEEKNKFELTEVIFHDDKHIILDGDVRWQSSSLLIATYTLLLRVAGRPIKNLKNWYVEIIGGKAYTGETQFHYETNGKFLDLIPNLGKFVELNKGLSPTGLPKTASIGLAHSCGIIGWMRETRSAQYPEAYKILKQALAA